MASSTASTVDAYLDELPPDRRHVLSVVRAVVREHLPAGYQETVNWGMISYEVPLDRYPNTYNRQPLAYAGLAAQKHHYALYLLGVHGDAEREARLRHAFGAAGKTLDMGKSCLRFRTLDDLPLDVIGETIAAVPPEALIAQYEASRAR